MRSTTSDLTTLTMLSVGKCHRLTQTPLDFCHFTFHKQADPLVLIEQEFEENIVYIASFSFFTSLYCRHILVRQDRSLFFDQFLDVIVVDVVCHTVSNLIVPWQNRSRRRHKRRKYSRRFQAGAKRCCNCSAYFIEPSTYLPRPNDRIWKFCCSVAERLHQQR